MHQTMRRKQRDWYENGRRGSIVGKFADFVDDLVRFHGRDVFRTWLALFPGITDHCHVLL